MIQELIGRICKSLDISIRVEGNDEALLRTNSLGVRGDLGQSGRSGHLLIGERLPPASTSNGLPSIQRS